MKKPPTKLLRVNARFAEYITHQAHHRGLSIADFTRRWMHRVLTRKGRTHERVTVPARQAHR